MNEEMTLEDARKRIAELENELEQTKKRLEIEKYYLESISKRADRYEEALNGILAVAKLVKM